MWYTCVCFRYVVLIIDEMKIREDLVYDKTGTCLHGFVNLGDVNNQLRQLEMQSYVKKTYDCLATQMLTIMVRGIFFKLDFRMPASPLKVMCTCVCLHCEWCRIIFLTWICRCYWRHVILDHVGSCSSFRTDQFESKQIVHVQIYASCTVIFIAGDCLRL